MMEDPKPSDTVEHCCPVLNPACSCQPSRSVPVFGIGEGVFQLAGSGKYQFVSAPSCPEILPVCSDDASYDDPSMLPNDYVELDDEPERTKTGIMETPASSDPVEPIAAVHQPSRSGPAFVTGAVGFQPPSQGKYPFENEFPTPSSSFKTYSDPSIHSDPSSRTTMHDNDHLWSVTSGRTNKSTMEDPDLSNTVVSCSQRHHSRPEPVVGSGEGVFHRASPGEYASSEHLSLPDESSISSDSRPNRQRNDRHSSLTNDGIATPLRFYFQNVRGLKTKIDEFYLACIDHDYDVIILVESWLDDRINSVQLFGDQYAVYRTDRNSSNSVRRVGGGVVIAVKKCFDSSFCEAAFSDSLEQIFVSIRLRNSRLFVGCIYMPPEKRADLEVMQAHMSCIEKVRQISSLEDTIVVAGDYNQPNLSWRSSPHGYMYIDTANTFSSGRNEAMVQEILLDGVARCNMLQINAIINHNGRLLDLVFISESANYSVPSCAVDPLVPLDAHHPALEFNVEVCAQVVQAEDLDSSALNFRRTNVVSLLQHLELVNWDPVTSCIDVDDATRQFNLILRDALTRHTPRFKPLPKPIWGNARLRSLKRFRATALRKYTRHRNPFTKRAFNNASANYRRYNRQRYAWYVRKTQEQLRRFPARFWSFVKSKTKDRGLPVSINRGDVVATTNSDKSQLFAEHFSAVFNPPNNDPISDQCVENVPADLVDLDVFTITEEMLIKAARKLKPSYAPGPDGIPPAILKSCISTVITPMLQIFNLSMQQMKFPSEWKKSVMIPVFKKGQKQSVENYRGITSLCSGSKLLELIVGEVMMFNCRGYISPQQHGFMPGRSVNTNLMEFTTHCFEAIGNGHQVDAIYTDLKAAFDRIDHDIAIKKLRHLGFSLPLCTWLESYLKNRTLQVKVGTSLSHEFSNASGVPQGSNLGPILFSLFFNDAANLFNGKCKLVYADDFKIYIIVENIADCHVLQARLHRFVEWCQVNRMTLSVEKCVVISFHHKKSREVFSFNYSVGDHILERTEVVKDLGVLLDSKLTFRQQQAAVIDKANRQLGFIFKIAQDFDDPLCLRSLYNALVRSHLESSSIIWAPYHANWIRRIENIQRKFVWYALRNLRWIDPDHLPPYEARCRLLGITTLEKRRKIAKAVFAAKILSSEIDSSNLLEQLNAGVQPRHLRARDGFFHRPLTRTQFLRHSPFNSMCTVFNEYFHLFEFGESSSSFHRRLIVELS